MDPSSFAPLSRRSVLAWGGALTALASATALGPAGRVLADDDNTEDHHRHGRGSLPYEKMQEILQAQGTVTDSGVLQVELDREDIGNAHVHDILIKPAFEIESSLTFQPLGHGKALFNGDFACLPDEILPVIDAILANGLIFQAEHQHYYDMEPLVWFIHVRGVGGGLELADRVHKVALATATPLPQAPPAHPTTPLDPEKLQEILHGYSADVGSEGIVTVRVSRRNRVCIDGIEVDPDANIATTVVFEPLSDDGSDCAVAPDFGMTWSEVNPVTAVMRANQWDVGCLYNQETDERPQLFFEHTIKRGDPYQLAAEVRAALDQMNVH